MRVLLDIPVTAISYGRKLPLNPKAFLFAIKMLQGDIFPPVKVERKSSHFILRGGRHRLAACKLLGRKTISACYGIHEDPRPDKPLVHKPDEIKHNVPQADGYSLPEQKPFKRRTWLEE